MWKMQSLSVLLHDGIDIGSLVGIVFSLRVPMSSRSCVKATNCFVGNCKVETKGILSFSLDGKEIILYTEALASFLTKFRCRVR